MELAPLLAADTTDPRRPLRLPLLETPEGIEDSQRWRRMLVAEGPCAPDGEDRAIDGL